MAFQREVGGSAAQATDYHDLVAKMVQFKCSQHVATVGVNSGGGSYAVGDIVELQHASAHLYARFEVTSESAGVITGLRIVDSGAYAQQATSATVSAGGSGYAVGDVLQVQGGSSRCPAKFQVATLSGSAVATVTLFEGGGVYSSTPSNPAATLGVGPSGFGGDDACTLTVTYQSIIGTTGLSVTTLTGGGSGATVDITIAETGWSIDGRDTNGLSHNGVSNEKEVVLVGDASGLTNKPYLGLVTGTYTSGINTRYFVNLVGLITHNPALAFTAAAQVGMRGDPGTFTDGFSYLLCNEDQVQNMDFWLSVDDLHMAGVININPGAANTDDGEYMHFYAGFMNSQATESENPYPYFLFASSRTRTVNPSASNQNITGMGEQTCPSGTAGPGAFFHAESGSWKTIINSQNSANQQSERVCFPMCRLDTIDGGTDPDQIVDEGPMRFDTAFGSLNRSSPTVRLQHVPGTTPGHLPLPLTILYREGGSFLDETNDTPRGQLRGCFWVYNTDSSGSTITNFSEDYVTIGSDRYVVFHTHVQRQLYHYICIKEDV